MKPNAKSPSAITLSMINFLKFPYDNLSNHMERGIYGPTLKGSSFVKKDFRLL